VQPGTRTSGVYLGQGVKGWDWKRPAEVGGGAGKSSSKKYCRRAVGKGGVAENRGEGTSQAPTEVAESTEEFRVQAPVSA
jgi:hypothetical protein